MITSQNQKLETVAPGVAPSDAATIAQLGTGGPFIPGRRDHSVNGAYVENFAHGNPILRTTTDIFGAGSYNGGGTGNKAILGSFLAAPLPLSALDKIDFTVELLQPEAFALGPNVIPYANLVVELVPASGVYSIFVFGDVNNPLLLGTYSVPGPNQHRTLWKASSAGSGVMVVLDTGMATFPIPPGPILVPVSQGAPQTVPAAWQNHAYAIADILVAYPNAQIVNASSLDGGLPKAPTSTAGLMLLAGSSGNTIQNAVSVLEWKLNGASI